MSVIIEEKRVTSRITGASETSYLVDNQSDVITIEIDIRSENYKMPETTSTTTDDYFMMVNPGSNLTGKKRDNRAVYTSDTEGFDENEFKVGDTFAIEGMAGANNKSGTIIEISEDRQTIITDQTFSAEIFPIDALIAITTPITALTFKHGLIENEESVNYNSKVDGSEQIAQVSGLDYSDTATIHTADMLGNKSWQFGSITVTGNGIGNGNSALTAGIIQAFTITHELIINPLMLYDEWDDIQAGIKPERLLDSNSLRYVYSV